MNGQQKPRSRPITEWIVIGTLWIFAVVVCILRVFGWISAGSVLIFSSLPCFLAGVWYGYLYFITRRVKLDWGLVLSGLGWVVAGVTFLIVGTTSHPNGSAGLAWLWGWLAVLLIIAGSVVGWLSIQSEEQEESTHEFHEES